MTPVTPSSVCDMQGEIYNLAAHALMYLQEGPTGNVRNALNDIMEISGKARAALAERTQQEASEKALEDAYKRGYTQANLDAVDRGEMKW